MAPPRRGRGSSKQGGMPSYKPAMRTSATSSSSRRIADIEDAPPISPAAASQLALSAWPGIDQRGRNGSSISSSWVPTVQGRVEYPRRAAPPNANNAEFEEILSVHSSGTENADDEDGSDREQPQDNPDHRPRAGDLDDGHPGPSRKRQASVTLMAPVEKHQKQGPVDSPSRATAAPVRNTEVTAESTVTRQRINIPPRPQASMPNPGMSVPRIAVDYAVNQSSAQDPAAEYNFGRELDRVYEIVDLTSDEPQLLGTTSNSAPEMARQNPSAGKYNTLKTQYDELEAKHKKLAADHRISSANFGQLQRDNDGLKKENEALRKQHFRDLRNQQITWCQAKEAADAAKGRIRELEQEVADLVDEIDTYEEMFMEESDREREESEDHVGEELQEEEDD